MGKLPAKHNPFNAACAVASATFTLDTESSNEITVAIQMLDPNGEACGQRVSVPFYLSDDANGDSILAVAVTTLAAGTDGIYMEDVAGKAGRIVSEADGDMDLSITFTGGAKTVYVVLVMPDGSLVVSGAVVFA